MFLLDTNVISETRRNKPHGAVLAWLRQAPSEGLYLSAISFGEIQRGIELTRALDPVKADAIEAWANQLADFHVVLPVDASIYRRWARLMHGKPDHHQTDGLIAATALVHGMTVVTRNVKDFKLFGVALINPFQYGR